MSPRVFLRSLTMVSGDSKILTPAQSRVKDRRFVIPTFEPRLPTSFSESVSHGGPIDPVEMALANVLQAARAAGQWAVVAQLAQELEARRTARAANVVDFGSEARVRGRP